MFTRPGATVRLQKYMVMASVASRNASIDCGQSWKVPGLLVGLFIYWLVLVQTVSFEGSLVKFLEYMICFCLVKIDIFVTIQTSSRVWNSWHFIKKKMYFLHALFFQYDKKSDILELTSILKKTIKSKWRKNYKLSWHESR